VKTGKYFSEIMAFIKKNQFTILGITVGAFIGYAYYQFLGCDSGICQIASNPIYSMIHGAIMGGIFVRIFD
jgi:hypothetical protein